MKFGEKLIQAGLVDQAQLDAALSHQAKTGQLLGEALLELGYISEEDYLKFLAQEFQTQYVSTQKLSRVRLAPEMLALVPVQLAEQRMLFPILTGKDGKTLGVVSCEPQNQEAIDEVRIITGMETVQVYVAHRDAIRAMIKKHYRGDIHAFDMLDKTSKAEFDQMMEMYGDRIIPTDAIQMEDVAEPRSSGPAVADLGESDQQPADRTSSWTRAIEDVREGSLVSDNDFIETLNILVGLLEMQLPNRQGHSARVAKMVKSVSERMGLTEREINHNITAAYLHDLGKRASAHLTLLSIGANKEHLHRAKRYHLTPSRLFDAVHLPRQVNQVLSHVYENYDGTGIPEELTGEEIPLGARIIAIVDAFDDLVTNSANLVGATLEPEQALARMRKEGGSLFDPHVLIILEQIAQGNDVIEKSADSRPIVLLADPDPDATSEIELKLGAQGFDVRIARDSETAHDCLMTEEIAAAIVEMDITPDDGFFLLDQIGKKYNSLPVYLVAVDPLPEYITKAFKEGASDFITKPFMPDVLIAKILNELDSIREKELERTANKNVTTPPPLEPEEKLVEQPPELVDPETGITIEVENDGGEELDESLPTPSSVSVSGVGGSKGNIISGTLEGKTALSLIRALSAKRRSGLLSLRLGDKKGEIYFHQGHIFQAIVAETQGEEAFLELASWHDCLYRFDPEKAPKSRAIKTPTGKLIQIAALSS